MSMLVLLVCAAILHRVRAEEIFVNRHFKGDMFSKQGELRVYLKNFASNLAGFLVLFWADLSLWYVSVR